jgi:hypothetical protein
LAKKNSAQKTEEKIKIAPFFISLKVAQGAQEAPKFFLELSLIGKAKINLLVPRGPHCGRVLLYYTLAAQKWLWSRIEKFKEKKSNFLKKNLEKFFVTFFFHFLGGYKYIVWLV